MINVSQEYKSFCESTVRPKSYIVVKYGALDKSSKGKYQSYGSLDIQPFASPKKLFDEIKNTNYKYISCEPNRVKLDDSFRFINNSSKTNDNETIAYWSKTISNENGLFETNPTILITFDDLVALGDITFYFEDICKSFTLTFYNDTNAIYTETISDNDKLTYIFNPSTSNRGLQFNIIKLEFISTKSSYRAIKLTEMDFGDYQTFTSSQIVDYNIIEELSLDGSELSSNSLNLSLDNSNGEFDVLNPRSKLYLLQEKQEISIFHNMQLPNKVYEIPLGTFLINNAYANGSTLDIEAYDNIYFMNDLYYGSDLYVNKSCYEILLELFNYFNYFNFEIDDIAKEIYLSGYIPVVSFREALRLICEASCLNIKTDRNGYTKIFKINSSESGKIFRRALIFGETPNKDLATTSIDVKEYDYTKEEETNVYEGSFLASDEEYIVTFNQAPIKPSTLTSVETNADFVITKSYATSCTIKVTKDTTVKLKASLLKTKVISSVKQGNVNSNTNFFVVDNPLITKSNSSKVKEWKARNNKIRYSFKTNLMPYIELGDKCYYQTKFNTLNNFIINKLEFTKSILQDIEGE